MKNEYYPWIPAYVIFVQCSERFVYMTLKVCSLQKKKNALSIIALVLTKLSEIELFFSDSSSVCVTQIQICIALGNRSIRMWIQDKLKMHRKMKFSLSIFRMHSKYCARSYTPN